jgi:DNA-binding ferritin-like protein (Dps family)
MFLSRLVGEKKRWREYKARARKLPPNYRSAIDAIERYLNYFGTGGEGTGLYADLIDLFEQAAANSTSVRDLVGDEPAEFVEAFVRNYPKGQWIMRERERLAKAIELASSESGGAGGKPTR